MDAALQALQHFFADFFLDLFRRRRRMCPSGTDCRYALVRNSGFIEPVCNCGDRDRRRCCPLDVIKKYIGEFRKVLSAKQAARFFQLEMQMQRMLDLQVAAELPLVE